MRCRRFSVPCLGRRPFQAFGKARHCDGQRVTVDWPVIVEPTRKQKFIVLASQLNCALDGFNRERGEANQMVNSVFCSLARNKPRGLLGLVEILKFRLASASDLRRSSRSQ